MPGGCAEGLRHLARELRTRQEAGIPTATAGWRRLSPSAELFIDPESGARSAIRDTGSSGATRYLWTLTVFGEHLVAEGRAADPTEARSQAEAALAAYLAELDD
jgi:hypothetical protein